MRMAAIGQEQFFVVGGFMTLSIGISLTENGLVHGGKVSSNQFTESGPAGHKSNFLECN
jgi:hypothetical protein